MEASMNNTASVGPSTSLAATEDCVMGRPRVDVDLDDVETQPHQGGIAAWCKSVHHLP